MPFSGLGDAGAGQRATFNEPLALWDDKYLLGILLNPPGAEIQRRRRFFQR
jgi:hypothetical protein